MFRKTLEFWSFGEKDTPMALQCSVDFFVISAVIFYFSPQELNLNRPFILSASFASSV